MSDTFTPAPDIHFHLTRTASTIPMKSQSGSVQGERMNPARVGRQQRYSCTSVPRSAWLRFIIIKASCYTFVGIRRDYLPRFFSL